MTYCEHIKDNGEQCRAFAVWGLHPPRCANHRLDGGATLKSGPFRNTRLLSKYYYGGQQRKGGLYLTKRDDPQTRLAKLFAQFHFLAQGMKAAQEADDLKHLLRLTHLKTDVVLQIVDEVEEFGGQFSDDALELAAVMVSVINAERDNVQKTLREKAVGTLKRSPGYWAVYRFIKDYISTYHISPTHREIMRAVGFAHKSSVTHYIEQLERDGFVRRIPGHKRNLRIIG